MQFEDLKVWQEARIVVQRVYALTRRDGLKRDFSLCDQVQRSAVSVMTNIAEGFERTGTQEKMNFYNIARASAGETRSLLYVIEDNYPDQSEDCVQIRQETGAAGRKITGLITSFRKRQAFITIGMLLTIAALTITTFSFS